MRLLIIAVLVFTGSTWAGVEESLVKVTSYPCQRPKYAKFGSGVLVKTTDRLFVLTSDHVIYHGGSSDGVCHKVYSFDAEKQISVTPVMINFAKGVALFEAFDADLESLALPYSSLVEGVEEELSTFGVLHGYPYGSKSVITDQNAQVMSKNSDRTILPSIKSVIEVNGHTEYGMSGGGFFDEDGRYKGLISHQYLQIREGKPAKLYESSEGTVAGTMIGLMIPAKTIVAWLDKYLSKGIKEEVRWDIKDQIRRRSSVVFDGIRFTPRKCDDTADAMNGDPVGIGGYVELEGKICKVALSLDNKNNQAWPFKKFPWLERVKHKLLAGGSAMITGLVKDGKRYHIASLTNLFSKMEWGVTPMIRISDPFEPSDKLVKEILDLKVKAEEFLNSIKNEFPEDVDVKDFAEALELDFELIENLQFEVIGPEEWQAKLDDSIWTLLMAEQLELAYQLKGKLLRMGDILEKLRV